MIGSFVRNWVDDLNHLFQARGNFLLLQRMGDAVAEFVKSLLLREKINENQGSSPVRAIL